MGANQSSLFSYENIQENPFQISMTKEFVEMITNNFNNIQEVDYNKIPKISIEKIFREKFPQKYSELQQNMFDCFIQKEKPEMCMKEIEDFFEFIFNSDKFYFIKNKYRNNLLFLLFPLNNPFTYQIGKTT
ncbi:hypothetical protein M0811_10331 [Anaeramoeba ignava]|uniref:Uncharacterized protein n=1 Tax=Anaeramoeba ignava TaxID=1746090 RepID=A0A9Q0R8W5_ANAIG|nr:hypothetical protein M0811_10300 [Anaeramoeba ignava]KAJ5071487.1 hypothetical protein M0811_10331 [Anaeramoeba ignava]